MPEEALQKFGTQVQVWLWNKRFFCLVGVICFLGVFWLSCGFLWLVFLGGLFGWFWLIGLFFEGAAENVCSNQETIGAPKSLLGSIVEFQFYFMGFTPVMLHLWLWFVIKGQLLN